MDRPRILIHAGALTGMAAVGQLGLLAARAATTQDDYKVLVCIFLVGGNDTNDMVVPVDTAGYANYARCFRTSTAARMAGIDFRNALHDRLGRSTGRSAHQPQRQLQRGFDEIDGQ